MLRPRFSLRSLFLLTAIVGYLIASVPGWYWIARSHYREHRIRALKHELSSAHQSAMHKELSDWYADRDVHP